jgi:hypothetical protein
VGPLSTGAGGLALIELIVDASPTRKSGFEIARFKGEGRAGPEQLQREFDTSLLQSRPVSLMRGLRLEPCSQPSHLIVDALEIADVETLS